MQEKKKILFLSGFWENVSMPKVSGLISDADRAIAKRVRRIRFENELTQLQFAQKLGVKLDKIVGVEYARTPLTVRLADRIAHRFNVSLKWLAKGEGRTKPCFGLIMREFSNIDGSEILSKIYSAEIEKKLIEGHNFKFSSMLAIMGADVSLPKGIASEKYLERFFGDLWTTYQELPQVGKEKLLTILIRTASRFSRDWYSGNKSNPGILEKKYHLTNVSIFGNKELVSPKLPALIERLKKITQERGQKTTLAKFLKVPLPKVSQWLAGEHEPGGETTLKLLHWVEQQERQK